MSFKILDRLSCYYGEDVYNFHNKIILKQPGFPGFRPHQDHAYWSNTGVRYPETAAVFVAIDPATEANGCLSVANRSHLLGVLPHGQWSASSQDTGVTPAEWKRLQQLPGAPFMPHTIPLDPGDAIFFMGQTIHASADNLSPVARLAFVVTTNTMRNGINRETNVVGYPCPDRQQPRQYDSIQEADASLPLPDFKAKFCLPSNGKAKSNLESAALTRSRES